MFWSAIVIGLFLFCVVSLIAALFEKVSPHDDTE